MKRKTRAELETELAKAKRALRRLVEKGSNGNWISRVGLAWVVNKEVGKVLET